MKPIKFRAWDKDAGRWALADDFPIGTELHEFSIEASWLELEQFTGLLDKNGKEIWEGDIVTVWNYLNGKPWGGHVHNCIVETVPGGWELKDHWSHESLRSSELEVIGNIHDNPELLK